VFRRALEKDKQIVSLCQYNVVTAKRGKYLLVPHGPVFDKNNIDLLVDWVDYLKQEAKKHSVDFIRIAPMEQESEDLRQMYAGLGFKKSPIHMFAELTSVVDLKKSDRNLQLTMRKTTRQLINKGLKLLDSGEITLTYPTTLQDDMIEVYEATSRRGGFVGFNNTFLRKEIESSLKNNNSTIFNIYHDGELLSWGLVIIVGVRAYYHQGGNILNKKIPAPYLLHWLGMKEAKQRGCVSYDFWGVSERGNVDHPWHTISQFKRGFGGEDFQRMHAQDLPLSLKYYIAWIIERVRSIKRGFG